MCNVCIILCDLFQFESYELILAAGILCVVVGCVHFRKRINAIDMLIMRFITDSHCNRFIAFDSIRVEKYLARTYPAFIRK